MAWTPKTKKQLRQALMSVYRNYQDLKIFVAEDLEEQLPVIVEPTALKAATFELIEWAESKGRLDGLYQAFCDENADNPATQQLVKSVSPLIQGSAQEKSFSPSPTPVPIRPQFEFVTVKVDEQGKIIERQRKTAEYWDLDLGEGVALTLVKVPAGQFWMGSPLDEEDRDFPRQVPGYEDYEEGPRHLVQISEFWMGKYAVTQRQWRRVADLPKVQQDLEPDPAYFKGAQRPVEQVSWDDAKEFCRRVSRVTGQSIALPSESQWEYACRAGTTTPFAFGPTLSSEIANYNADYTYGKGLKGKERGETLPVGQLPANGWGLFGMHGNVWEWCEDTWFPNYDGAPTNGTARQSNKSTSQRLLRGGSWFGDPGLCRSACRTCDPRDLRVGNLGFRVVCSPQG